MEEENTAAFFSPSLSGRCAAPSPSPPLQPCLSQGSRAASTQPALATLRMAWTPLCPNPRYFPEGPPQIPGLAILLPSLLVHVHLSCCQSGLPELPRHLSVVLRTIPILCPRLALPASGPLRNSAPAQLSPPWAPRCPHRARGGAGGPSPASCIPQPPGSHFPFTLHLQTAAPRWRCQDVSCCLSPTHTGSSWKTVLCLSDLESESWVRNCIVSPG